MQQGNLIDAFLARYVSGMNTSIKLPCCIKLAFHIIRSLIIIHTNTTTDKKMPVLKLGVTEWQWRQSHSYQFLQRSHNTQSKIFKNTPKHRQFLSHIYLKPSCLLRSTYNHPKYHSV